MLPLAVADPGFPVGGRGPRRAGMHSQGGYVSQILYVKTTESGPLVGGCVPGTPPLNPPMIGDVAMLIRFQICRPMYWILYKFCTGC